METKTSPFILFPGQFSAARCDGGQWQCPSPSFPHAFSGNPGEPRTGPPIRTFGGDNFGENYYKVLSIPRCFAAGFFIQSSERLG